MSPRLVGWLIATLLALTVVGVGALFWVQNESRRVIVSLNLGFTQIQTVDAMPLPTLMAICAGVGLVVGFGLAIPLVVRSGARARRAERQAALGGDVGRSY
jgi:uncharacterized membrane protein YciS (DUF1049 family)